MLLLIGVLWTRSGDQKLSLWNFEDLGSRENVLILRSCTSEDLRGAWCSIQLRKDQINLTHKAGFKRWIHENVLRGQSLTHLCIYNINDQEKLIPVSVLVILYHPTSASHNHFPEIACRRMTWKIKRFISLFWKKKKLGVRTKWKREKPTGKNRAGNGKGREEPKWKNSWWWWKRQRRNFISICR